jgi:hypothetical protein
VGIFMLTARRARRGTVTPDVGLVPAY